MPNRFQNEINKFQNAIYGEEVRGALISIAEALGIALDNQLLQLDVGGDAIFGESGKAASSESVANYTLWHKGRIDFIPYVAGTPDPIFTTTYNSLDALNAQIAAQNTIRSGSGAEPPYIATTDTVINLNNYTYIGIWQITSNAALVGSDVNIALHYMDNGNLVSGPYVANCPSTDGGQLIIVGHNPSKTAIGQIYITTRGEMYVRSRRTNSNSTWSDWSKVTTSKDAPVIYQGQLSHDDDINTLLESGFWTKVSDSNDTTWANTSDYSSLTSYNIDDHCKHTDDDGINRYYKCIESTTGTWDPTKWTQDWSSYHPTNWPDDHNSSGTLMVISKGPTAFGGQYQIRFRYDKMWVRYHSNDGWYNWREFLTNEDYDDILSMFDKSLVYRRILTQTDDLDTFVTPGIWRLDGSSYSSSEGIYPNGWPFKQACIGQLIVTGASTNTGSYAGAAKVQFAINSTSEPRFAYRMGKTYVDANGHPQWGPWVEVASEDAIDQLGWSYLGKTSYVNDLVNDETDVNEMLSVAKTYYDHRYDEIPVAKRPAAFNSSTFYGTGATCSRNGSYYTCVVETTGEWDSSKWEEVEKPLETTPSSYSESKVYKTGNYCTHNDGNGTKYYRCTVHASSTWTASEWKEDPKITLCLQYGSEFVGKISCSVYQRLVMKGITYANSQYIPDGDYVGPGDDDDIDPDPDDTEPDIDPGEDDYVDTGIGDYGWAVYPERSRIPLYIGTTSLDDTPDSTRTIKSKGLRYVQAASQLANWMVNQGLRLTPASNYSNLEPGDFLFYSPMEKTDSATWIDSEIPEYRFMNHDGRYYGIRHIAVVANKVAIKDARDYVKAEHEAGRYIDGFYDSHGDFIYDDDYQGSLADPLSGYPWPYVHFTLEVVQNATPTTTGPVPDNTTKDYTLPYCVHRKFVERSWGSKRTLDRAAAGLIEDYSASKQYQAGDLCMFPPGTEGKQPYKAKETTQGTWNPSDWTNVYASAMSGNNLCTTLIICRPDLGHMKPASDGVSDVKDGLYVSKRIANTENGLYTINIYDSNHNLAETYSKFVIPAGGAMLKLDSDDYLIRVYYYKYDESTQTYSSSSYADSGWVSGRKVFIDNQEGDKYRVYFKRVDGVEMTDVYTDEISEAFSIYVPLVPDNTLTVQNAAADAKTVGDLIDERTIVSTYETEEDLLTWTFGGLWVAGGDKYAGKGNDKATNRIRLRVDGGSGAFPVRAGSTISANDGYKFNVAEYSYYTSNSDFDFIEGRNIGTADYVVPQDCYIRVSVGRTDDADLWETDDDGEKVFTSAGETAQQEALVMNLLDCTLKTEVEQLKKEVHAYHAVNYGILELSEELPLNALEYHTKWNELVDNGFAVRIDLPNRVKNRSGNAEEYSGTDDYPINGAINFNGDVIDYTDDNTIKYQYPVYLYKIESHKDHMMSSYDIQPWQKPMLTDYDATATYKKNKLCLHNGKAYKCTTAITTPEAWNSSHWAATTLASGQVVLHDGVKYRSLIRVPFEAWNLEHWTTVLELYDRPKIFLTCGIHGNERSMSMVVYDFCKRLYEDEEYQEIREAFDWYIIPLVNPWGYSNYAYRTDAQGNVVMDAGGGYTTETKDDEYFYVAENTSEWHQGIRRTASGIDPNRDYGDFAVEETQNVRDAAQYILGTGGNIKFAFAIDGHLAVEGNVNGPSAFLSLDENDGYNGSSDHEVVYTATEEMRQKVYNRFMQAGGKTMLAAAKWTDREPNVQYIYPWAGKPWTESHAARNYMQRAGFTDISMTYEGGQTCQYYSGLTAYTTQTVYTGTGTETQKVPTDNWSCEIARGIVNTQYQNFLKRLTEYWM